jgi:hypothetical protein
LSCLGFTTFGAIAAGRAGEGGAATDGLGVSGTAFTEISGDGAVTTGWVTTLGDGADDEGELAFKGGNGARVPPAAADFIGGNGFFSAGGLFPVGPPGMFRFLSSAIKKRLEETAYAISATHE